MILKLKDNIAWKYDIFISYGPYGMIFYVFGSQKILRKEKNTRENDFFMFCCPIKNIKENQI